MDAQPTADRRKKAALALAVLYGLALIAGTHIPRPPQVIPAFSGADKWLHFSAYTGLSFLVCLNVALRRTLGLWPAIAAIVGLAVFGALDEITQTLVGRDCEFMDWTADVVGSLCGLALLLLIQALFRGNQWRTRGT